MHDLSSSFMILTSKCKDKILTQGQLDKNSCSLQNYAQTVLKILGAKPGNNYMLM